jgi:hypothetical protein
MSVAGSSDAGFLEKGWDWVGEPTPARPRTLREALSRAPPALRTALEVAGATSPGVVRGLTDGTPSGLRELVRDLLPGTTVADQAAMEASMRLLFEVAAPEAAQDRRRFEYLDPGFIVQEVLGRTAAKRARVDRAGVSEALREADAAWKPAVRPARFRLRGDARLAAASGPTARADAEAGERARWIAELLVLIKEVGGPIVEATRASADPDRALSAVAGGRRARTLGKRVCAWRKVRAWCMDLYSDVFPRAPLQLIEYLQSRADEPCGKSALQSVVATFSFMEDSCGYARGQRLVDQPLFLSFVKELLSGLDGAAGTGPRQAPRFPLGLVLALEREVVDVSVAAYYRCYAWWVLVSLRGSLRFDDHRGLPPSQVEFTARGLEAKLTRTKTSGPGKRVSTLPLLICQDAYLVHRDWLRVGWELWQAMAPFARDYFLVKPSGDLNGAVPIELSYEQSSRLLRAVLSGLPRAGDVMEEIAELIVGLFTQHSPRCWLPSMAALQQIEGSDLAYLGRWAATAASTYVRTATEVILRIQSTVARRIREGLQGSEGPYLGEEAAAIELRRVLQSRGLGGAPVEEQLRLLDAWTRDLAGAAAPRSPRSGPAGGETPPGLQGDLEEPDYESDVASYAGDEKDFFGSPLTPGAAAAAAPTAPLPGSPLAEPALPVDTSPLDDQGLHLPEAGFVVSISKSGWRRLHRLGGCGRHPGVHYLHFELLGEERPDPEYYDDHCLQCWKTSGPAEAESSGGESETENEDDGNCLLEASQEPA